MMIGNGHTLKMTTKQMKKAMTGNGRMLKTIALIKIHPKKINKIVRSIKNLFTKLFSFIILIVKEYKYECGKYRPNSF